jgi:hypothetical protein
MALSLILLLWTKSSCLLTMTQTLTSWFKNVVDDFAEPYEVEYMSKEGVTVLKDVCC